VKSTEYDPRMRVVSPELVLVDPELAEWFRLRLREDAVAELARASFPPATSAQLTPLEFVPRARPERPAASGSWLRMLRRESVVVTAVSGQGGGGKASATITFATDPRVCSSRGLAVPAVPQLYDPAAGAVLETRSSGYDFGTPSNSRVPSPAT
jgi:hypothetical protein